MKIALAQIDCACGDSQVNTAKILEHIEKAADQDCRLVVFPEMSDTGYEPSSIPTSSSSWDEEYSPLSKIRNAAREKQICVAVGLSEKTGQALYNTLAVIGDKGELLAKYRKINLFTPAPLNESSFITPGSDLSCVEIDGLSFGLTICYDLRFPNLYQQLALRGAKVLINSAVWPQIRASQWDVLTRARAIENQCFFVGVSRVGKDAGLQTVGHSRIVSPMGELLVNGGDSEELLFAEEYDTKEVDDFRAAIPSFNRILERQNS